MEKEVFVYADLEGNVGWAPMGFAPIRPNWDGLFRFLEMGAMNGQDIGVVSNYPEFTIPQRATSQHPTK